MKSNKQKRRKRRKIIKAPRVQTCFSIISIIFIIGCFIFYGYRLIKYYRIYNPKSETGEVLQNLASAIINQSEIVYDSDGLYINNGNYIYKGENVNNYLLFQNMLFRIVKINADKTIDIVLDDYINKTSFSDKTLEYEKSSINSYLTANFVDLLDKSMLEKVSFCKNSINQISEVNCEIENSDLEVRLLGLSDILNSINNGKSYLVKDFEHLWLYNHSDKEIWHTTGVSAALADVSEVYEVKPVLTLKNTAVLVSGNGEVNNPYQVSNNKDINIGTYLDINNDIYIVYEVGNDYYKIQSNNLLKEKRIFDTKTNDYANSSLKKYLEDTYLAKLSYQDLLKEVKFSDIESKIGILSKDDLKFNDSLESYFISDKQDKNIGLYNSSVISSRVDTLRNVRIALGITKDLKIISGNGSKLAPFIVEVE